MIGLRRVPHIKWKSARQIVLKGAREGEGRKRNPILKCEWESLLHKAYSPGSVKSIGGLRRHFTRRIERTSIRGIGLYNKSSGPRRTKTETKQDQKIKKINERFNEKGY